MGINDIECLLKFGKDVMVGVMHKALMGKIKCAIIDILIACILSEIPCSIACSLFQIFYNMFICYSF